MLWLEIVNAAFDWSEIEDVESFLKDLLPGVKMNKQGLKDFWTSLRFIRKQLSAAHFGQTLDHQSINRKVASIKLEYKDAESLLPQLHAARTTGDAISQLEETVFLHFAVYLSDCRSAPNEQAFRRCEGVYKPDKPLDPAPDEDKWRSEIAELADSSAADREWERCGDFFVSTRGRFCSETCRTRTFQLTKQLNEPDYLAEKQRRYRARKSESSKD
jgi:hypothetical protein